MNVKSLLFIINISIEEFVKSGKTGKMSCLIQGKVQGDG